MQCISPYKLHNCNKVCFEYNECQLMEIILQVSTINRRTLKKMEEMKAKHSEDDTGLRLCKVRIYVGKVNDGIDNILESMDTKKEICISGVSLVIGAIQKIMESILDSLSQANTQNMVSLLFVNESKLEMLLKMLSSAMRQPNDSIFYKSLEDIRWKRIQENGQILYCDKPNYEKNYKSAMSMIFLSGYTTAMSKFQPRLCSFITLLRHNSLDIVNEFYSRVNCRQSKEIWSRLDSNAMKFFVALINPFIKVSQVLYIPKLLSKWESEYHSSLSRISTISSNYTTDENLYNPSYMVKVRVISNQSIYIGDNYSLADKSKYPEIDRVIVQIHGGGFIAMSSYSYQPFAREWVKNTRSVMFCIDYGLAPERPYPNAIEDIWQAYYWIMTQAQKHMNVQPKHVVVIGDSAGGNLATALALKCIREGMPAPKLVLCYPALNLSMDIFSPSMLVSFEDSILRYSVLFNCVSSYVGGHCSRDSFISPITMSDEEVSKFAETRFMLAGRDPLRDESYRLMDRLLCAGRNVKYVEYRQLPHGFLNFASLHILPQANETIKMAEKLLSDLLEI